MSIYTLGQIWNPDAPPPQTTGGPARWWSRTRPRRRRDDDWGWRTVVRFRSHSDGVRWLADLGERPGRLVTSLTPGER